MSKSQTVSPLLPSSTPLLEIPAHLKQTFDLLTTMSDLECWRFGAPVLQQLGCGEPTVFRNVEPEVMGKMFRDKVEPTAEWFAICEDLGRFLEDRKLLAIALLRIGAVRLVGST